MKIIEVSNNKAVAITVCDICGKEMLDESEYTCIDGKHYCLACLYSMSYYEMNSWRNEDEN